MQFVTLGESGLVVSRLALGTMTFGPGPMMPEVGSDGDRRGAVNDLDQTAASRMVHTALDAGVNLFDTADAYTGGQAEEMLGRALKDRRSSAIIATKAGFRTGKTLTDAGLSYRHLIAAAEASLRRLQTDYIDIYLLHVPDPLTPLEETARACEDLVRRGLVRYLGYSNYPAWMAQRLLDLQTRHDWRKLAVGQVHYSLLCRDVEFETGPFIRANGLGLMVWAPLSSGFLSGKYTRDQQRPADSRRGKSSFPPIDLEHAYQVVDQVREIADARHATPSQVAIAWLLHRPFVSSVIVGANKQHQLEDNLGAAELELGDEELQRLDAVSDPPAPYPFWPEISGRDTKLSQALHAPVAQ